MNFNFSFPYREKADVFNFGTRLEYEFNDQVAAGIDLDFMKEERWGVYNGLFHPMGFKAPNGKTCYGIRLENEIIIIK